MRRSYILVAAAALVVALAAGVWWLARTGALVESTRARVVESASRALGREVQVDAIGGDPFRGIVLSGVRIGSPPGVATGPLFAAPRITIIFDSGRLLRDLARRRGIGPSINRIILERPLLVLARDTTGRWNYADLLSRQQDQLSAVAFRGQVEVVEGSLVFSDALRLPQRAGPNPPSPFGAHFDRISGTLDFRGSPEVGLVLDMVNTDGRTPATARVVGKATLGRGTFDLDLTTRGGSVDFWGPYIVRLPWLEWSGGTFDGTLHLLASRWRSTIALDYRGTLRLRDGRALLLPQGTLLSDIDGPLAVDNLGVATEGLTLALDASPLWVRGSIGHHAGVYLDLALRSEALDLHTLQEVLFPRARVQLSGRAGGDARIVGPFGSPRLEGEIVDAAGRIDDQVFADASGRFSYYGGVLVFDDVSAAAGGGRLLGHLRLDLERDRFFVLADARSVELASLTRAGLSADPTLRGTASGFVVAASDPGGLLAQGRVSVGPGRVLGVAFDRLEAIAGTDRGRVEIDRLDARSGPSRLHAFGAVERSGAINVLLTGLDLDLRAVARRFGFARWLSGTADVQGHVEGTLRAPVLDAGIRARGGAFGPIPFDSARGPIRVTTSGLSTPGLLLTDGPARYSAAGTLQWTHPGLLDLNVTASDVPAARLMEIAGLPVEMSGTLSGAAEISGSMQKPVAAGTVELVGGRIEGQPVDRAGGVFRWTGAELVIERLDAQANSSTLTARGTVGRDGRLGISFAASDLDVRDIAAIRIGTLEAAGHVNLSGTVSGTVRAPLIAAAVTSGDLVLNGQSFTRAEGAVRYRRGSLQLAPLALQQDGGSFTLAGTLRPGPDPTVDLRVTAAGGELATLLGLARVRTPITMRGTIDGTLTVSGPLRDPRAGLDLRLSGGRVGDHVIEEAAVAADLLAQAVSLRTFRIKLEQGELVGAGRIDLRGESEVEFGGTGLNLDLLRPLLNLRRPLQGTFDVTLQLTGTRSDPVVGLSFSAAEGAIGAAAFDQLLIQAFYRGGQLNIEHGLLQQDRHKVRLTGTLPVDAARLRLDQGRPLALRLELVDADLSALGLLTDRVESASGPLSGGVTLTGTAARPDLEGSLAVTGGTVKLRGVSPAVEEIAGQVTFTQEQLRVTALTARMGGGEVSLTGTAALRNFRAERLAFELRAAGARIQAQPLYVGAIDAGLRIEGTMARPEISGALTFSEGDVFVSSLTRVGGGPRSGLDPALDVGLAAGENLWVNVGGLRLQIDGGVHARGSWRQPRLVGEITADRGAFTAFNNTFILTEGRATFSEFRGVMPFIDAQAETRDRVNVLVPSAIPGQPPRLEPARVFLHVTGTPDALNLAFSSDPPFARDAIVAGLARQAGVSRLLAGEETLENVLRAELSSALFGSVGRAVAQSLGLEEFAIEYDFVHPLTLRIGRLLIKDLYLTLTSEFGIPRRNIWALEWRISPNTMFSFAVDNFGVTEFLYRITYRF
ncbi:MAG TPA: translocation/assembly module TamB domain-containing protein [bacterium]|nr:translocation/assembly module TamB domain-containing protein [bacterium]